MKTVDQQRLSPSGRDHAEPAAAPISQPQKPEVLHLVAGWRARVVDALTRLSPRLFPLAPRSVCGVVLWGDPDTPDLPPDSPLCPRCLALDGRDPATVTVEYVPGYWL